MGLTYERIEIKNIVLQYVKMNNIYIYIYKMFIMVIILVIEDLFLIVHHV